ncbi:MAG: D-alanyl-D-alanine carboxypeptidase/D-alanyl-D-alanine-endopeptidase [Myxococcales bacterium]|nr:D-alanyl-D-alanine carboxypeptidase/D-alanyl-D-alanine-endopeptidase [Myxococcales bacterium]
MRAVTRALLALVLLAGVVDAKPRARVKARIAAKATAPRTKAPVLPLDVNATIAIAGEQRKMKDLVAAKGRLSVEEETAQKIALMLRGPLRNGETGLYVADARTGTPLFAINADEAFNPASNVKMISTAAALELLGPTFRYPTRVLGPSPEAGVIKGDIFLLGSYDPTLTSADVVDLAAAIAAKGITRIEGGIVVGPDPTRDGIYRAMLPIEITAGEPGAPPVAVLPMGADHVTVTMLAKTAKRALKKPRLTYKVETTKGPDKRPKIHVTVRGTLGKGATTMYPLSTRERTATAAYALKAGLVAHGVTVSGDLEVRELGEFVGDSVGFGTLPEELARHESRPLADIVTRINKWSINWLADRVIMTAAALAKRQQPSMELALEAMYAWLDRHPHIKRSELYVDTGSGLSYRTRISPAELVKIVRSAAGYAPDSDAALGATWMSTLAIAGTDGTLRHRVRGTDLGARVRGKTGTLSTVIAMSGLLDVDPERPLAFALVTNTKRPLSKGAVRRAHDQVISALCTYVARTTKVNPLAPPPPAPAVAAPPPPSPTAEPGAEPDAEETERDPLLDAETSAQP